MKVNAELKKDAQRFLQPYACGGGSRRSTHFKSQPEDVSREELHQVLIGTEDVPRRVVRAIAKVSERPVSTYLGGE